MAIETLLKEKRIFRPSKKLVENSNVMQWMKEHKIKTYDELLKVASKKRSWFWGELAKELEWFSPWKKVLDWKPPYAKWFIGGKFNIVHNALDRHANSFRKNKLAYIWEGEPGEVRKITYGELYREVNKFANALKELGVKKGDRVAIYLPMIPELPISMLACAKIGAIHSVVFSGYSAKALQHRINDASAKVLITVDGFYRHGKVIKLKDSADEALKDAPSVKKVVVVKRAGNNIKMKRDRDLWWHDIIEKQKPYCKTVQLEANTPLYILYTSGTTGTPKGVIHDHGGYAVGTYATLKWVFDLKEEDVWWCAADIGWVTGHSYIVYAPLMLGVTSVMYEGAPTYPDPDRVWQIIEKYGVTVFYTAPTAVRMFMRFGRSWVKKHDLSTLRLLGSVGEPINPSAWIWYYNVIGNKKCPIMDTYWQTETGMFVITPLPITPLKPGSATKPFPSIEADVYDENGKPLTNKGGDLVLTTPYPAMLKTLYKNSSRYEKTYWSKFKNMYLTGDVAHKDKDGYIWVQGREDDVLNVAGHRIGTAEVESALVSHPAVVEAAVVGKPDKIRGTVIKAFVILKQGTKPSSTLVKDLKYHVGEEIGHIAKPAEIVFVDDLPKTRSGKIMRRVIEAIELGKPTGDISTLRNPETVNALIKLKNNRK